MPRVRLIRADELLPGQGRTVTAGGIELAVFHVDGSFFTLGAQCPHLGGPLGEGTLRGTVVTCPWHGWQFDVTTGQAIGRAACAAQYSTCVEDGWVVVQLP
jgi:nitrite reductase (NADH) small subunit